LARFAASASGARRLLTAKEARVLDGHRGLLGEAHADRLVLVVEGTRRAIAGVEQAATHLGADEDPAPP